MSIKANEKANHSGPLKGVKVVEYGVFHAGPGASAILGDLGADIIKIETLKGDPMRDWSRIGAKLFALPNGESLFFEIANRNKKSVCLDINTKAGRDIFHRFIKEADVFLTNVRKSTKTKMQIDYPSLSKINPRLIHANVSGYGPKGPASDLGAYDPMGQARSGMIFISGSDEPVLIQIAVLDQFTSIAASHAILTALFDRTRTGVGQEVHASLFGSAMWLLYVNMIAETAGIDSRIKWDRYANSPVRNNFRCKDGKWIMGVHHPEEKFWPLLCRATGLDDLINNPKFIDYDHRMANCRELVSIFDTVFIAKTRDEWIQALSSNGMMFSPAQSINEVYSDPQALENGYVVDFNHPVYGKIRIPGYPLHFDEKYTVGARTAAPKLGEHTDLVLGEMGYSEEQLDTLKKEGIIR